MTITENWNPINNLNNSVMSLDNFVNIIHWIIIAIYLLFALRIIYKHFKLKENQSLLKLIKKMFFLFLWYIPIFLLFAIIDWYLWCACSFDIT